MAHSLSAQKRVRQNAKRRLRNRRNKTEFRGLIREYRETLLHGTVEDAQKQLAVLYKKLDQVAAKGSVHAKTASRYKSRLTIRLNAKKAGQAAPATA
jgi:small subunit ribosomal protein S20